MIKNSLTDPATIDNQIATLKEKLTSVETRELDYLILAHSDDRMVLRLNEAFAGKSIAAVTQPQSGWDMESEDVAELIEWAANETGVKKVLLVGSSQGGTGQTDVQVCPSGVAHGTELDSSTRSMSIKERVNFARNCSKKNEDHFTKSIAQLRDAVSTQNGRIANPDFVQGLFYRAESGVFCAYDCQTGQFRPILTEELAG